MKIIANGGVTTKNVPNLSRDAIILTLYTPYVEGVAVDVKVTKDHYLILLSDKEIEEFNLSDRRICDMTLAEIRRFNLGNKVKRHDVMLLKDAIELYSDSSKPFIVSVKCEKDQDFSFVNQVIDLLSTFPNVNTYIKSCDTNIVTHLCSLDTKVRIGAVLSSCKAPSNMHVDFFSLCHAKIDEKFIKKQLDENLEVMFEQVDSVDDMQKIDQSIPDLMSDLFVITTCPSLLSAAISQKKKQNDSNTSS